MRIFKTIIVVCLPLIALSAYEVQAQNSYTVNYECSDNLNPSIQGSFLLSKGTQGGSACLGNYFVGYTNLVIQDGSEFLRNFTLEVVVSPDKNYSRKLVRLLNVGVGEGLMKSDFSDAASFQSSLSSGDKCDGGTLQELESPLYVSAGASGLKSGITSSEFEYQIVECSITISNNYLSLYQKRER